PASTTTAIQNDLAFVDRKGTVEPLRLPPGFYEYPRVSPDGKRVAFGRIDDSKDASIWTITCRERVRRNGSRSVEGIDIPFGRQMASGSHSNRIVREISVSSGKRRTGPDPRSG